MRTLINIFLILTVLVFVGLYWTYNYFPQKLIEKTLNDNNVGYDQVTLSLKKGIKIKNLSFKDEDSSIKIGNLDISYTGPYDLFVNQEFHITKFAIENVHIEDFDKDLYKKHKEKINEKKKSFNKHKNKYAKDSDITLIIDDFALRNIYIKYDPDKKPFVIKNFSFVNFSSINDEFNYGTINFESNFIKFDIRPDKPSEVPEDHPALSFKHYLTGFLVGRYFDFFAENINFIGSFGLEKDNLNLYLSFLSDLLTINTNDNKLFVHFKEPNLATVTGYEPPFTKLNLSLICDIFENMNAPWKSIRILQEGSYMVGMKKFTIFPGEVLTKTPNDEYVFGITTHHVDTSTNTKYVIDILKNDEKNSKLPFKLKLTEPKDITLTDFLTWAQYNKKSKELEYRQRERINELRKFFTQQ